MNIITIVSAIVVFLVVIFLLVSLLLWAKAKLTNSGPVNITLNGEREITVEAGSTLLTTLSNNKVFLPSACGGGGTCAMCKCRVLDGGGDVLPTEVGHLNRTEQKDGLPIPRKFLLLTTIEKWLS